MTRGLFPGVMFGLALAGVLALVIVRFGVEGDASARHGDYVQIPTAQTEQPSSKIMKVVYLNREGARVYAGGDDSEKNRSSIVHNAGLEHIDMPAFQGTAKRWRQILECIRAKFAAYDVQIVDQRPIEPGYIMAVFGGKHELLGGKAPRGHKITGLSPYNAQPIPDAVVLVFSRAMKEKTRDVCETAAMEIAHAYGLDHALDCHDLMTHLRPCGARKFVDKDNECGEHDPRVCGDGLETQNSHGRLLDVLGAAAPEK